MSIWVECYKINKWKKTKKNFLLTFFFMCFSASLLYTFDIQNDMEIKTSQPLKICKWLQWEEILLFNFIIFSSIYFSSISLSTRDIGNACICLWFNKPSFFLWEIYSWKTIFIHRKSFSLFVFVFIQTYTIPPISI